MTETYHTNRAIHLLDVRFPANTSPRKVTHALSLCDKVHLHSYQGLKEVLENLIKIGEVNGGKAIIIVLENLSTD